VQDNNITIACPERALVDMFYLDPEFYFDNLNNIDWDYCIEIAKIYQNKSLNKRINKLKEQYA